MDQSFNDLNNIINQLKEKYVEEKKKSNEHLRDILEKISNDYSIDLKELEKNYLGISDKILNQFTLNNQIYYYEKKPRGKVFDETAKVVGKYSNSNHLVTFNDGKKITLDKQ